MTFLTVTCNAIVCLLCNPVVIPVTWLTLIYYI
jgi:hypothetical protein